MREQNSSSGLSTFDEAVRYAISDDEAASDEDYEAKDGDESIIDQNGMNPMDDGHSQRVETDEEMFMALVASASSAARQAQMATGGPSCNLRLRSRVQEAQSSRYLPPRSSASPDLGSNGDGRQEGDHERGLPNKCLDAQGPYDEEYAGGRTQADGSSSGEDSGPTLYQDPSRLSEFEDNEVLSQPEAQSSPEKENSLGSNADIVGGSSTLIDGEVNRFDDVKWLYMS